MLIHGMRASYGVGTPDPPVEFVIVVAHPFRDVHPVLPQVTKLGVEFEGDDHPLLEVKDPEGEACLRV
jgi:hypothetical protein